LDVAAVRRSVAAPNARATGLLGLLSTAVILGGSLISAIPYTGWTGEPYSPLNHFISELGETARSDLALIFNLSVFVGGAGLGLFLVIVSRRLSGRYVPAMTLAGIVAEIFGMLVAVLPMDTHLVHRVVSALFFVTGWMAVAIFSLWLRAHPRSGFPRWLLVPGAVCVAAFVAFLVDYAGHPTDPNAHIMTRPDVWSVTVLEWAALLSLLVWFACLSLVLVRRRGWRLPEA
jgi:hypothetical membrane protein